MVWVSDSRLAGEPNLQGRAVQGLFPRAQGPPLLHPDPSADSARPEVAEQTSSEANQNTRQPVNLNSMSCVTVFIQVDFCDAISFILGH